MTLLFESETCSRCGGTGHYSYCQTHGTTCFKCGGRKVTLTKRGSAAQAWFTSQKMKPATDVKIGDKIVMDGVPGFSRAEVITVTFVGEREDGCKFKGADGEWHSYFHIDGVNKNGQSGGVACFKDSDVKMHVWGDEKAALVARALAYQDTLTKAGTVKKGVVA